MLELMDHNFVARGAGCFLPTSRCVDVGRELNGGRARLAFNEQPASFTGYAVAMAVGIGLGLLGGGYLMFKFCTAVPGACR